MALRASLGFFPRERNRSNGGPPSSFRSRSTVRINLQISSLVRGGVADKAAFPEVDRCVGEHLLDAVENRQEMTTGLSVTGLRWRMLDAPKDAEHIGTEREADGLRPKREPVTFCGSHRCLLRRRLWLGARSVRKHRRVPFKFELSSGLFLWRCYYSYQLYHCDIS